MPRPPDDSNRPPSARLTPYELVFTEGDFESVVFPAIGREAEERGIDPSTPERFAFLSVVGDVLREVTPEDAPPDALDQYRALLFHSYHFQAAGKRLYVLDRAVARFLVEATPEMAGWAFVPPGVSGYVQLPANLFWSSIAPDTPPEPVDGFFFTEAFPDGAPEARDVKLLLVLGVRRSRAGFSVVQLDTGVGADLVGDSEPTRPEGDFTNALPGGEISGLYSILTTGEAFRLAARAFWYVDRFPAASTTVEAPAPRESDADPPPSRLQYVAVTLGE
jgi:hypothetical protein